MKRSKKALVFDIILLVLSSVLTIGVKTVFSACEKKPDGMWMSCHWAEQAVFALGIALIAMAVVNIVLNKTDLKRGIALAMVPTALITAFVPNVFIDLCMMKDMHCHEVMRPAVIIISAVIAVAACVYAIIVREKD
ncbi:MAG: DUF4418 family protein [Ruminococcus sp.]|nr:DUF4418 family protein [Ruminococcus sp.]